MPTYEYRCKSCGNHLEVVQGFQDVALTTCPSCEGPLRKVFGNIGISFKGTGFYSTDNRSVAKSGAAAAAGGSDSSGGSGAKSESGGTGGKAESGGSSDPGSSTTKKSENTGSNSKSSKSESKAAAS